MLQHLRRKRLVSPQETSTYVYAPFVLIAVAQLGGDATEDEIQEEVEPMMRMILKKEDYVLVRRGESGLTEYAPIDETEGAWEIWRNRVGLVIMRFSLGDNPKLGGEKYLTRQNGMCYITAAGLDKLAHLHTSFDKA